MSHKSGYIKLDSLGSDVAVFALGDFFGLGKKVADEYRKRAGKKLTLVNPKFITGLDKELLDLLKKDHQLVVTLEDGILEGGYGQTVASYYGDTDMKVINLGIAKSFPSGFTPEGIMKDNGLAVDQIVDRICRQFS